MTVRPDDPARMDARESPRHDVSTSVIVRGEGVRTVAEVRDLSEQGARLAVSQQLQPGSKVKLKLPLLDHMTDAFVVWCNGVEAGCRFHTALPQLDVEKLRHILRFSSL